jgi:RecB family exonuclease
VPAADPSTWWGVAEQTDPGVPMRADDQPIKLSASSLEQLGTCPLQWFLQREAKASKGANRAAGFGSIVHALAEAVSAGSHPADLDTLTARIDAIWPRLEFEIPWHSARERDQARRAVQRFLEWHAADRGRAVVAAEREIVLNLDVAGRPVQIRGRVDRIEIDDAGRVWVIDFKTSKTARTQDRVSADPQLAVYQMAVREGGLSDLAGVPDGAQPGGAELVFLRCDAGRKATGPKVIGQAALGEPGTHPADDLLEVAVRRVAAEHFPAVVGLQCNHCEFTRSCPADVAGQQVVR